MLLIVLALLALAGLTARAKKSFIEGIFLILALNSSPQSVDLWQGDKRLLANWVAESLERLQLLTIALSFGGFRHPTEGWQYLAHNNNITRSRMLSHH